MRHRIICINQAILPGTDRLWDAGSVSSRNILRSNRNTYAEPTQLSSSAPVSYLSVPYLYVVICLHDFELLQLLATIPVCSKDRKANISYVQGEIST